MTTPPTPADTTNPVGPAVPAPLTRSDRPARLGIRDLVTIGIFTAILFVLSVLTGTILSVHPSVYLFNPALFALLGAVFYTLIITRVRKPGAAFLTAAIFGLGWGLLGGWLLTVLMLGAGLVGELILARGGVTRISRITWAWIVFVLADFGGVFGVAFIASDSFRSAGERTGQDPVYIEAVVGAIQSWLLVVALAAAVVTAIAGMQFASRMLRKHFAREQH